MGLFKDLRQAKQDMGALQELGKQQQESAGYGRGMGGLMRMGMDGMHEATEMLSGMQTASADAQHLAASGVPGTATISAVSDSGITINENPTVDFDLMVSVPGREPYPVRHRQTVPRLQIGQLVPGAQLAVRVDPVDPQKILISG
jgi:hypothetical protein